LRYRVEGRTGTNGYYLKNKKHGGLRFAVLF
jgi:hypothetical protein